MKTKLPTKNSHGVTIRNEQCQLADGDQFTLFSNQVRGCYDGYPHYAIPGRYVIAYCVGDCGQELVIAKVNGEGRSFICQTEHVYAILGEWSNYQKAIE